MNANEKQIKLAAKLYECRDTAKRFFKEEYREILTPYEQIIKATMKANNIDVLPALLRVAKTSTYLDSPMSQMLFMAATVEMIEPES